MHVIKYIEKDIEYCYQCPYYHESRDMGATNACCELYEDFYLSDVGTFADNHKISKYCPYKEMTYMKCPRCGSDCVEIAAEDHDWYVIKCLDCDNWEAVNPYDYAKYFFPKWFNND